jgi:hypothetical protein
MKSTYGAEYIYDQKEADREAGTFRSPGSEKKDKTRQSPIAPEGNPIEKLDYLKELMSGKVNYDGKL